MGSQLKIAKDIIKEMIKSDKIPGAFIFEGTRNAGNYLGSEISYILAKSIVCQNTNHKRKYGESCGACESCLKAEKNIHPDIIVSEADGDGSLSFHIDKVRELINGLYLAPNDSDTKVYIIKDMQNMTPQGQNALLKSIEEPPPFVVFIITVTDCDLILETVKSRAVKFTLDYNDSTIDDKSEIKIPEYGDIILDILSENSDKLTIYQKLSAKFFEKTDKSEILRFYSHLENALRDILIAKIFMTYENKNELISFLYFSDLNSEVKKLTNLYSTKKILNLSKKIHEYKANLDYNINTRLNLISFFSSLGSLT